MKILAFGTFDIFHAGHGFFLQQAARLGQLHVVIARDKTVEQVKGRPPFNDELSRQETVNSLSFVHSTYLGSHEDKYCVIQQIRPDIIMLGYDQEVFTKDLKEILAKRNLQPQIIRLQESLDPKINKSSLLRPSHEDTDRHEQSG